MHGVMQYDALGRVAKGGTVIGWALIGDITRLKRWTDMAGWRAVDWARPGLVLSRECLRRWAANGGVGASNGIRYIISKIDAAATVESKTRY